MPPLKEVSSSRSPEELLRQALEAESPAHRERLAREALEGPEPLDPDTKVLLLRQLYLAHLDSRRFRQAADAAIEAAAIGPLEDVAHHDASRALAALQETDAAIAQQRLAVRASPAGRRSFHYWGLATLLHFAGRPDDAIAALTKGERWAHADRPLLRAHRAWVRLEIGEAVRGLDRILSELEASRAREGYGQLVLGMLRYHMGDLPRAAVHLRAFLRRNAALDTAKAVTLREELRRARTALAEIESD